MLVTFRRHKQFGNEVAHIDQPIIIPQGDEPGVGAGPYRQHGKSVGEFVNSLGNFQLVSRPSPNHLPVWVMQRDAVNTPAYRLQCLDEKPESDGTEGREDMGPLGNRIDNFPSFKSGLETSAPVKLRLGSVDGFHRRFVGGDDFVSRPVLANGAVVDPDDAVAQAANLIELMRDEDNGAARSGHVAPFAEAFLLETDVADGENFIH